MPACLRFIIPLIIVMPLSAHADNASVCDDNSASDATRLAACSRVISAYRPGRSGTVQYNEAQAARLTRLDIYDRQGKTDLALKDANAGIELGRQDPLVVFFYSLRAGIQIKFRRFNEALAQINSAIDGKPSYVAGLYSVRSEIWEAMSDLDRALDDRTQYIKLRPDEPNGYTLRARLLLTRGDKVQAEADYAEALRLSPDNGDLVKRHADFLSDAGDMDKALVAYNEAIRLMKNPADAYNARGILWRDLGDFDKALADFDQAIKLEPRADTTFANRGEIWRLKGDLDRALQEQNQAIKIDPRNMVSWILRGDTYRYRGESQRAISDYNEAFKQAPDALIPAATGRGLVYEKMGDVKKAQEEFQTATQTGQSRNLTGMDKSRFETAQAHLAALRSGEAPPTILTPPIIAKTANSLPTPSLSTPVVPEAAVPHEVGKRVALVIGNAAYRNVPELTNPKNDAEAVAKSLRDIGFSSVELVVNKTKDELVAAIRNFAEASDKADWAVVYYAGHGIEVNGQNYLIPVDASLKTDRDVQFETVPVEQVMSSIDGAKKLKLIVLDACRDNPFAPKIEKTGVRESVAAASTAGGTVSTRSIGRGLGEVKVSGASLVVFSAKHGQTALDGDGANSPFAVALVQRVGTPGVEINKVFRLVRDDVMEATAGRQEPYTYGSLPGKEDFFFVAAKR